MGRNWKSNMPFQICVWKMSLWLQGGHWIIKRHLGNCGNSPGEKKRMRTWTQMVKKKDKLNRNFNSKINSLCSHVFARENTLWPYNNHLKDNVVGKHPQIQFILAILNNSLYSIERKVAIFVSLYLYPWSTSFHTGFEVPGKSLNEMQHLTSGLLLKELIWQHNSASPVKWDKFKDIKKHPLRQLESPSYCPFL